MDRENIQEKYSLLSYSIAMVYSLVWENPIQIDKGVRDKCNHVYKHMDEECEREPLNLEVQIRQNLSDLIDSSRTCLAKLREYKIEEGDMS